MWVYEPGKSAPPPPREDQALSPQKDSLRRAAFSDEPTPPPREEPLQSAAAEYHEKGSVVLPQRAKATPQTQKSQPLFLFVASYFMGLCLSGVILGICPDKTAEFLGYYAQNWLDLFFKSSSPLHLFSTLFLSGVLSMTLVLLLGLSAFGMPFVYLALLCKGAGSGLLALELFLKNGWRGELLYIAFPAVSDVFLAWCLCSLGYFAVKSSRSFLGRSFQTSTPGTEGYGAKLLVSRYLYLCTLQILSCGLSAVVAQYAVSWFALG